MNLFQKLLYLLNILGIRTHRPGGFLEKLVEPLKPHRTARGACVGTFPLFFEKIPRSPQIFFSRVLPQFGREFSDDMPLVCERFKIIYK